MIKDLDKLLQEVTIYKMNEIKPNYSALASIHHCDRRTIKKFFTNDNDKKTKEIKRRKSKLDKYKDEIKTKLEIPGVTSSGIYLFLKSKYPKDDIGSASNLRAYILKNKLKLKSKNEFHPRYETEYGKQLQFDWKEDVSLQNKKGDIFTFNVFSATLCASRFHIFIYSKNKTRIDVERCLVETFEIIGGIPEEILTDNMSSIVNYKSHDFDKEFKSFVKDMGTKARKCKIRHSYTKGKVESSNRFINWIKAYDKEFDTEEDLIKIINNIMKESNNKANETTGVPPTMLYQKEKEYLKPLPNNKLMNEYKNDTISTIVSNSGLIYYKGIRYSVSPDYINKKVYITQIENELYIYYNKDLIKKHTISDKKINYDAEDYILGLHQIIPKVKEEDLESKVKEQLELFDQIS